MKDAKGHGSNKRGVHAQGVEQVGNLNLHPNVLSTIMKNPGGFSVKPSSGLSPKSGYMVSLPGHTQIVAESDIKGPNGSALIQNYARQHAGALQQAGAHIGGWTDSESGKVYLDVSQNIRNKGEAVHQGVARNQKAIWDVKRQREISTGGTGD